MDLWYRVLGSNYGPSPRGFKALKRGFAGGIRAETFFYAFAIRGEYSQYNDIFLLQVSNLINLTQKSSVALEGRNKAENG